jgi:hypothetical protein
MCWALPLCSLHPRRQCCSDHFAASHLAFSGKKIKSVTYDEWG